MTHLLDTSALLAHYFGEPGGTRVQALFEDENCLVGTSILALFEFELRLCQLGMDEANRRTELDRYRSLLDKIVDVDEAVRSASLQLRVQASSRVAAMDVLIAGCASVMNATLVHRDPHFGQIPARFLKQEVLPNQ